MNWKRTHTLLDDMISLVVIPVRIAIST